MKGLVADGIQMVNASRYASVTPARPALRALVVDDYRDAAESLARLLETLGCTADFVTESTAAMDAAAACNAEVVFIDIGMPGINGFDLATMFRERYGAAIRLIAATAYGGTAVASKCRDAGFDFHLHKPVAAATLERTLDGLFPAAG
jgi:CheY-like chemotaxis protein